MGQRDWPALLEGSTERRTQLKAWALAEGRDPRDKRRDEKVGLHLQRQVPTLGEYAEHYLEVKAKTIKAETVRDYRNILRNIVLPVLGAHTKINDYSYMRSRKRVLDVAQTVADRGSTNHANRVLMVMRGVFQLAISEAYLDGRNPADPWERLGLPAVEHHPHLELDELEAFIAAMA